MNFLVYLTLHHCSTIPGGGDGCCSGGGGCCSGGGGFCSGGGGSGTAGAVAVTASSTISSLLFPYAIYIFIVILQMAFEKNYMKGKVEGTEAPVQLS
ncbi:hypothetical protein PoB_004994700 [Plakobranchus ocellatus]|uniref:Uncharacterized protein n=1 Tax=Plakobranchus ocellatus TaxID=259542 RepID=A0AAV4BVT5_9GAST|nr:hypothetical protein PoB_004994700 [Plakobranchus ocellatus]